MQSKRLTALLGLFSLVILARAQAGAPPGPANTFAGNGIDTNAEEGSYSMSINIDDSDRENTLIQQKLQTDDADATVLMSSQEELLSRAVVQLEKTPTVVTNEIAGTEGLLFSGTVATFTIPHRTASFKDFSATIDWGDGSTTAGIVGQDLSIKASHTYVKFGLYAMKVTVSVAGASHSSTERATVSNAPITATGLTLVSKTTTFKDTVASFTDANPFGVIDDYSAAISWGDGRSSGGTIVAAGAVFKVVGSHNYEKQGSYVITVSIEDQGGATASATTQLQVGPLK